MPHFEQVQTKANLVLFPAFRPQRSSKSKVKVRPDTARGDNQDASSKEEPTMSNVLL